MISHKTHEMRVPTPEHQSIFTDTYHGVPNPQIPHEHPYPTRFHGPVYGVPRFGLPYRKQSWQTPSGLPGLSPTGGCTSCSGFGATFEAGASIDSSGVDLNTSVDLGGGKTATKGDLVKAVLEIIERRKGAALETDVKAYIITQILMFKNITVAFAVLTAFGFEQRKEFVRASSEWTKARGWMAVRFSIASTSFPYPSTQMKTAAKKVSALFDKFAAEDLAGGPKRRILAAVRPSSTVLDLVSTAPLPTPAPPMTKMAAIEPEGVSPWLILGGVVIVGTVGYFVWKSA